MAYDEATAARVRAILARGGHEVAEKKMFGGVCFMVRGHMCCGFTNQSLMLRVGKAAYPDALDRPHARPMTFTGRPLEGFVYVRAQLLEPVLLNKAPYLVEFSERLPGELWGH